MFWFNVPHLWPLEFLVQLHTYIGSFQNFSIWDSNPLGNSNFHASHRFGYFLALHKVKSIKNPFHNNIDRTWSFLSPVDVILSLWPGLFWQSVRHRLWLKSDSIRIRNDYSKYAQKSSSSQQLKYWVLTKRIVASKGNTGT